MPLAKQRSSVEPGSRAVYPVLPLRDIVVFPHMIVPLFVGREKSIKALEEVVKSEKLIMLATQKNAGDDDPATDAIYSMGTLATVLQLLKLPDGTVKVLVEGVGRGRAEEFMAGENYMQAEVVAVADIVSSEIEAEALARSVVNEFEGYVKLNKKISPEVVAAVTQIEDYAKLADTVASHLAVKITDKQDVLELPDVVKRLEKVLGFMESEISVLQVEKRIRSRVKRQMEKTQREYYLNEQMKAIQKELGDEEGKDELGELEERINKTKLSKEAREKSLAELKKLRQMSPMSAEATVIRNYLDWMLSLPWGRRSKIKKDLPGAQAILDWRKSKSGLSNISPFSNARISSPVRSSVSLAPRVLVRHRLANRLRKQRGVNLCACRSVACVTRLKFAVIVEPILVQCPVKSFNH